MEMNDIRTSIKAYLAEQGVSLSAFSARVGISQPSLWNFLNEKSGLSGENTLKLLPYCTKQKKKAVA